MIDKQFEELVEYEIEEGCCLQRQGFVNNAPTWRDHFFSIINGIYEEYAEIKKLETRRIFDRLAACQQGRLTSGYMRIVPTIPSLRTKPNLSREDLDLID